MNVIDRIYSCKYCGKEFYNGRSLAGHATGCSLNPKHIEICQKIRNAKISRTIYIDKTIQCPICKNYYKIHVSKRYYDEGNYCKTCSSECAHKLSVLNTDSKEKIEKIKNTFKNKFEPIIKKSIYTCVNCGKKFEQYKKNSLKYLKEDDKPEYWSTKYCCKECMIQRKTRLLSESAKRREFGGFNSASVGAPKYHKGNYKNIHYDSSWELAFIIYNIEHNINIKRCKEVRKYIFEDKIQKYYPDFVIDGNIYEIKGYMNDRVLAKSEQNPDIKLITYPEIKIYIDYAEQKYGKKFWNNIKD